MNSSYIALMSTFMHASAGQAHQLGLNEVETDPGFLDSCAAIIVLYCCRLHVGACISSTIPRTCV